LVYEIIPIGFLIEKAGGKTDDGSGQSVLDLQVKGYEQRTSFIAGSIFEVEKMNKLIK
jgi:fructose-1,6-bisphosphatase